MAGVFRYYVIALGEYDIYLDIYLYVTGVFRYYVIALGEYNIYLTYTYM